MKVALIGSSHTVALQQGFDRLDGEVQSQIDLTSFAVGGNRLASFAVNSDGVFGIDACQGTPQDRRQARQNAMAINGRDALDLTQFNAIVFTGYPTGIDVLLRLFPQVQIDVEPLIADQRGDATKTLVSAETVSGIKSKLLAKALNEWPFQNGFQTKVLLVLQPLMFEKVLRRDISIEFGGRIKREIENNPKYPLWIEAYRDRFSQALSDTYNVEVVPQPPETISKHPTLSADAYCNGASTLSGAPQTAQDFTHANAVYGEAVWRSLLPRLRDNA